ncbi:unnamed protein product [Allacma fusca]|uniref:Fucosyltransferase N-terminal domain-containing protein n=1 Tax=Allacma fusca TaxID=39272 RepID=A0A8J2J9Z2_9HEXA|nr:unnamed protein product [Allacma fusca]
MPAFSWRRQDVFNKIVGVSLVGIFLLVLLLHRWHELKKQTQLEIMYTSGGLKRILFWTPFFTGTSLKDVGLTEEDQGYQTFCPHKCKFTTNKNLLHLSDAVLFHGRNLQIIDSEGLWVSRNIPETRNWTQHWIFYYFESADYTFVPLNDFNNVFNQTISYRLDSDIHTPYSRLLPRSLEEINNYARVSETIKKKTKMAAWIVSNCVTKTNYERYLVVFHMDAAHSFKIWGPSFFFTDSKGSTEEIKAV